MKVFSIGFILGLFLVWLGGFNYDIRGQMMVIAILIAVFTGIGTIILVDTFK